MFATSYPGSFLYAKERPWWSALDHIELTYHDVIIFAIPEIQVNRNSMVVKYKKQNGDDTGVSNFIYIVVCQCVFLFSLI